MDRISHSTAIDIGGGRMGFRSKDTVAGIPGTVVAAGWLNPVQEEIMAIQEAAGLAPDGANWAQVLGATRSQAANYRAVGGTANALTFTSVATRKIPAYVTGQLFRFLTGAAANTGACTFKADDLAAIALVKRSGGALVAGDLPADTAFEAVYIAGSVRLLDMVASDAVASTSIVGRTQVFLASGTFTVPAGVTKVRATVIGAGGAAGGSGNGSGGGVAGNAGAGGGGGGYSRKDISGLVPGATISVTVGAGGVPVASATTPGGGGGSSSFGAYNSASGGGGGSAGNLTTGAGGSGGTGTGGDINITGAQGGFSGPNTTSPSVGGEQTIVWRGGMAAGGFSNLDMSGSGSAGKGYGSGGNGPTGGAGAFPGGAGAPGIVIVEW